MSRVIFTTLTVLGLVAAIGGIAVAQQAQQPVAAFTRPDTSPAAQGQFASRCAHSHAAADDPIVFPGEQGAAHLHEFFGATTTAFDSTPESLRASDTSCITAGDTAAYWVPALYDGDRRVVPFAATAYYLTWGKDPATVQPFPADLQMIAGPDPAEAVRWTCVSREGQTQPGSTQVPQCGEGEALAVRIHFPDCWNGTDLDAPDHRSHMAYASGGQCPDSHPVPVPRLRLNLVYLAADGGADVTLSSGGPETMHADFVNAWDQQVLEGLVTDCLQAATRCGHLRR
jgi:hypothetical protein